MMPITGNLVILLNAGVTVTPEEAMLAGQTAVAWLGENTWGRLQLTPAVYSVALTTACTDASGLRAEAQGLMETMGITWFRLVIVTTGCSFAGLGNAATGIVILNNTFGVLAHELGHTFNLAHNALMSDPADPMNAGYVHFNTPHKGKIDWMLSTGGFNNYPAGCYWDAGCEWVPSLWSADVLGDGEVAIAPTEVLPTTIPIAHRIPVQYDPAGRPMEYLYLEYRTPVGFDSKLAPQVQLRLGPAYNGFQSFYGSGLSGATQYVRSLSAVGMIWTDCSRQLSVRVTGLGAVATAVVSRVPCLPPPPPDLIAPTVILTNPVDGSVVARRSTITLHAEASDNVAVARVMFLVNGTTVSDDGTPPWEYAWRVPAAPNKTYRLQALALDSAGNIGHSTIVTVRSQ